MQIRVNSLIDENDLNPENKNESVEINNEINENNNNIHNSYEFKESDIWILFGDLNFRIDMDYEEFFEFIKNGQNWKKLLEYE